jgi:outer membrane protein TolC
MDAELDAHKVGTAVAKLPDLSLGLPSELARNRPDVAAAEAQLHSATANIGLAMADLYPRVVLGASFGLESTSAEKFGDWGSRQWSVGPSLSIPLFDRGRRHSIVNLRELQQQEAAVSYQQTVLKAWHEVESALAAYRAEQLRGSRLEQKVSLAEEQESLAQMRYSKGVINYLPLSTAQFSGLEAKRDLTESLGRQKTLLVALYKALGTSER